MHWRQRKVNEATYEILATYHTAVHPPRRLPCSSLLSAIWGLLEHIDCLTSEQGIRPPQSLTARHELRCMLTATDKYLIKRLMFGNEQNSVRHACPPSCSRIRQRAGRAKCSCIRNLVSNYVKCGVNVPTWHPDLRVKGINCSRGCWGRSTKNGDDSGRVCESKSC